MSSENWFEVHDVAAIDSPALILYKDRIQENINRLVKSIDVVERLRPHIKTHKSPEVTNMMLASGIKKFKCATIAEAEMLASQGAPDILLAYQPVGPKCERLLQLVLKFPTAHFSCLIDNIETATFLSTVFEKANTNISVCIDLNVGMNRTGVIPALAQNLFSACQSLKGLTVIGLHAYDGHLRDPDLRIRTQQCDNAFADVVQLQEAIKSKFNIDLLIVAGGTPTYSIHAKRKTIECSPGTFIYWDKGYEQILKEQHYLHAALVITRVISLPANGIVCVDLGHKAIASENPLPNRVHLLNAPGLQPTGHSEEHMVFTNDGSHVYNIGDVLYGVPYHVCPTVALYEEAVVVNDHVIIDRWTNTSRKRKISV